MPNCFARSKWEKKAKSLFQKPASERVLGHWTLEVSHHLTNTKSTFEMLSNKSSPGKCLTFQNRTKHKLNENQSELFSSQKPFQIWRLLFLAPLLTAWSPSHLFPADHFGHLSCHNYAPWTRSANCRLCSAAAFDVIDAWSP